MKKLRDPQEPLRNMFALADRLKEKLGPILYQLPPSWPVDVPRFKTFLHALPHGYDHVIEFRHPSWFTKKIYALEAWASKIKRWLRRRHHVYVYFNNDRDGNAAKNADDLKSILS